MDYLQNQWRGLGLPDTRGLALGDVVVDPALAMRLLAYRPDYQPTPLTTAQGLADQLGLAALHIKDERGRMGLGSFKALGAGFAIAKQAYLKAGDGLADKARRGSVLAGTTFVTASAGNHGLSMAAAARVFGAQAVVYLAATVPASFADVLRSHGAQVVIEGAYYEASMAAAAQAAVDHRWTLLSDSTWDGCLTGQDVMEGYLTLAVEVEKQISQPPTHIFLQAGVGGLAASLAAYFRKIWGDGPQIIVVEPKAAPALQASIRQGRFVVSEGPTSEMGRLDCKEASHLALKSLAVQADGFLTLSDGYVSDAILQLEKHDLKTSSSGGAGYAGLRAMQQGGQGDIGETSRVLLVLSEGATDD